MVARDFDRARATAKAADAAVARGDDLPPLHGLPIGIKDLQDTAGLRTTYGSPIFRDHVPAADERLVAAVRAAGRDRRRQDQHAGIRRRREHAQRGLWRDRQSVRSDAVGRRFLGRLGGGAGHRHGADLLRLRHRRLAAQSRPRSAASSASARRRAWSPTSGAALGWSNLPVAGPMARTVPDLCLLLSAMVSDDARDPLATTVHGRTVRRPEDFAVPARIDLSRLRVALTPDFGFAPTERHIAEVFAEKTGLFRHVFARAEDATPDCAGADEAFEVLRAVGFLASHRGEGAHPPAGCRAERARQCRGGAALLGRRCRAGA